MPCKATSVTAIAVSTSWSSSHFRAIDGCCQIIFAGALLTCQLCAKDFIMGCIYNSLSADSWWLFQDPTARSTLFWGDEVGDIHTMEFLSPVTQLFEKSFTNQKQTKSSIYMLVESLSRIRINSISSFRNLILYWHYIEFCQKYIIYYQFPT